MVYWAHGLVRTIGTYAVSLPLQGLVLITVVWNSMSIRVLAQTPSLVSRPLRILETAAWSLVQALSPGIVT